MAYSDLVGWMFKLERFGIKLGLENITEFLSRTGDPHKDFRSIHVTGTNGKGSVCAFIASILQESGLKVGLYTSPHLVDFRERIVVNGRRIPEADVVRIGEELRTTMEAMAAESGEKQLTFFEFTTGLAFRYFSEQKVDVAVVEVGMGGRLDATNVLTPEVAVITRIGLEHTAYLGNTLEEIAREKAGIIKAGVPVVSSERGFVPLGVIQGTCSKKGASLRRIDADFRVEDISIDIDGTSFTYSGGKVISNLRARLIGAHQGENASVAIAAIEELEDRGYEMPLDAIIVGVSKVAWPGRLDVRSKAPLIVVDGSHNPEGVKTTVSVLASLRLTPLTFVVACMDDKDARGIISALAPHASEIIATEIKIGRSTKAESLREVAASEYEGEVHAESEVANAMLRALSDKEGKGVCAIGSFYLAGEVLKWLHSEGMLEPSEDPTRKV
ncbi:TPA: bifunctional folylpolyglutamate synthase/dihydrofolate synthase [Thermoplasmata archaeon]|nr:bifunctional folylpolyglutamate synthase/dihydrofolate synthase [Thermoplasmata archaeon]